MVCVGAHDHAGTPKLSDPAALTLASTEEPSKEHWAEASMQRASTSGEEACAWSCSGLLSSSWVELG